MSLQPDKKTDAMANSLDPFVLELLASRICHDLVSPVGAVNNGVEFFEDAGPEAGADAMALIAHSAGQAQVKLKCFRLAYGAGGREVGVSFNDIREAFEGWIAGGRFTLSWPESGLPANPPPGLPKVLLNTLLLAEECGPGGEITVSGNGDSEITVSIAGGNVAFRDGAEDALEGKTAQRDLNPRLVHAYILRCLADEFGVSLTHSTEDGQIIFTLRF